MNRIKSILNHLKSGLDCSSKPDGNNHSNFLSYSVCSNYRKRPLFPLDFALHEVATDCNFWSCRSDLAFLLLFIELEHSIAAAASGLSGLN